ncbi:BRO family protein, partial [Brevibacillus laterosporus]|uniref:BRO-N domain-containing protein n=1 Tax=Brevibacillus laterosporus TaxID=1465 RepID=UPI00215BC8EC
IISESALYSLILRSWKPEAKVFKRWITHEVIPSIRKHGAFMTAGTLEKALTSPDFLIQLATKLKEEQ